MKPSYLNTARHQLEKKKNFDAEDYGWLLVIGKEHPDFDMYQFFKRYPDAMRHVYRLRDLMKYRIVEWDTSKHFIDPVRRTEFKLNSEKSNSSEIKDNSLEKVENRLQEKELMSEESESTVIHDMSNRIKIQPLNPKDNSENKRPQTDQVDDREVGEGTGEGFFGRMCKKLKSAF